jgi:hypothetical protein
VEGWESACDEGQQFPPKLDLRTHDVSPATVRSSSDDPTKSETLWCELAIACFWVFRSRLVVTKV